MRTEWYHEEVTEGKSIIVVSDLHLGGEEGQDTAKRFSNFIKRIKSGDIPVASSPETGGDAAGHREGCPNRLLEPELIILLGDVLDLWNPRNQDRNNAFIDALVVFLQLQDFSGDVIYVTGNHDEDIGDIVQAYAASSPDTSNPAYRIYSLFKGTKEKVDSLKICWNGENFLEISPRHYPATTTGEYIKGLKAGGVHYVFVHGQQFDDQQVTYSIGKALGCRFDIIDTFQELFDCSFIRTVCDSSLYPVILGFSVLSVLACIVSFFMPWYGMGARAIVGSVVAIGFLVIFLSGIKIFGFNPETNNLPSSSYLYKWCAVLAVVELVILAGAYQMISLSLFDYLCGLGFIIFLWLLFTFMIPKFFAGSKNFIYSHLFNAKYYDVTKVYLTALKSRFYTYNAEVMIFGHTHAAGTYPKTDEEVRNIKDDMAGKPTLLINTGCWVKNNELKIEDCFAYIDNEGAALMEWDDTNGTIFCRNYFPAALIKNRSELIRKK
jgi:UDP-2,3-diacylglucosamine pyrophosphatase LpxH